MSTINLEDADAGLSRLVDRVVEGEFVTIARDGKPVAALVSVEAAEIARHAMQRKPPSLVAHLKTFPGGELERYNSPSRDAEL